MSLTAGIVIVLVLLARILLRKAPKIFSYVLWTVVLFRLVCPVSFSSELSLLGLFHTPSVTNGSITYIPEDIVHTETPRVDLPLPGISEVINDRLPEGEEQLVADPLEGLMAIASLLWLFGIVAKGQGDRYETTDKRIIKTSKYVIKNRIKNSEKPPNLV